MFYRGADDKAFLSTNCNLILANSWIEKKNYDILPVHVKSKLTSFVVKTEGDTIICIKNDRKEAKKYDDNTIETYKVKDVHGTVSLKPVRHILIELLFLSNRSLIVYS